MHELVSFYQALSSRRLLTVSSLLRDTYKIPSVLNGAMYGMYNLSSHRGWFNPPRQCRYVVVLLIIRYGGYRYPCRPLYKPTHCGLRCQRKDSWSGILPVSLWTIHISTEHRLRVLPNISLLRERCRHPFVSLARSPPPIVPSFLFFLILVCFFEVYPRRGLMRLSITLRSLVPRAQMIHGPARFQDRPSSAQSCVATPSSNILAGTASI
ncbi:hypothetical protein ARMGADRAFT_77053 [Armillaria gallica]|uniref:Uncharacterized protein n=1 Tax=Armillaria gallica TaxID=47427 RepID=A0A2H3CBC4_ARMGA|nr:hypothetical protein ARMGADRAFT_176424 [Armillaria gallica]PBK80402.1 hypothetical protein ARMGADRAFT_77053 [Armillaria gallica]